MQGLLELAVVDAGLDHDQAFFGVEHEDLVHVGWRDNNQAFADGTAGLVCTRAAGGHGDGFAALGQLPGKAGDFAHVLFVARVDDHRRHHSQHARISGKILPGVLRNHNLAKQMFLQVMCNFVHRSVDTLILMVMACMLRFIIA